MKPNRKRSGADAIQPPSLTPLTATVLAFWVLGTIFAFYSGHYSDRRVPQVDCWLSFLDLLSNAGHILATGLGWNLILAALMWFVFSQIGAAALDCVGLTGATKTERWLISSGLGAGLVSLAMLGLGLLGHWKPDLLKWGFLAVAAIALSTAVYRTRGKFDTNAVEESVEVVPSQTPLDLYAHAALVLIASAVVMNLLATAAPETFFDSLIYHLALPKLYLLRGQIVPTPQNLYSGMPFGIEMLYGLALSLSNEHLATLLHCSFGWGAALALGAWLRRSASRSAAILGILLFALCPVVLSSSWQSGIDLGTTFYASLTLIAVSRSLHAPDERQARRWAAISGTLIGFAFGTKYTAVPLGAAFIAAHGWIKRRGGGSLRDTLWMAAIATITFSPWLLKNFRFYGDPLYPFLHDRLGSTAPAHWDMFLGDAHSRNLAATLGTLAGWKTTLLLPWRAATDMYFDYRVSLAYLMLFPFIFMPHWGIVKKEPPVSVAWTTAAMAATAGYVAWCMTSTLIRFLTPTLLIVAGIFALALERSAPPSWLRQLLWILVLWICLDNFTSVFIDGMPRYGLPGKWDVLSGRQSPAEYLESAHVGYGQPYYAAMEFINRTLPRDARIAFLGESRAYYCERDFIAATPFDHNPFWTAAHDAKSADELRAKLRSLGITHVFLNAFQLYSNAGFPAALPRDTASRPVFMEFWARYLQQIFEKRETAPDGRIKDWLVVYALRDKPESGLHKIQSNPISDVLLELRREGH